MRDLGALLLYIGQIWGGISAFSFPPSIKMSDQELYPPQDQEPLYTLLVVPSTFLLSWRFCLSDVSRS
ncbi:hypothetical protein F5Y07DRAFT_371932 [Xylaria sp. FL0933]|nr:hypothetical protein F5Y07DRAFT_371932 [Xylaria sp. FL0933]